MALALMMQQMSNPDLKIIKVKFNQHSEKSYLYKTVGDIAIGDTVLVVVSPSGINAVRVLDVVDAVEYIGAEFPWDLKWVAGKVNLDEYHALMQQDLELQAKCKAELNKLKLKKCKQEIEDQFGKIAVKQLLASAKLS